MQDQPNEKLCECGCGLPAPIAKRTKTYQGHKKGEPMRFVHGHNMRKPLVLDSNGYEVTRVLDSSPWAEMRDAAGNILVHRVVMAEWMGRPLKRGEVVHHKNGDRRDNRISNLQLFSSNAEHSRLHAQILPLRQRGTGR